MPKEDATLVDAYTTLIVTAYQRYRSFWINLARTSKLSAEDAEDILHGVIGSLLSRRRPGIRIARARSQLCSAGSV